jgi:hypothetical protein
MAVPVKHKMYIKLFYKWSSENRFFSTKVSLGRKWRDYGAFL